MTPGAWVGLVVGCLAILGALWQVAKAAHRFASLIEHLGERMTAVEKALTNGLRTDVRMAATKAEEAARLAGQAAQRASLAEQRAEEFRNDLSRGINAVRAELDIYTNVVITDRNKIRRHLRELGRDVDDED